LLSPSHLKHDNSRCAQFPHRHNGLHIDRFDSDECEDEDEDDDDNEHEDEEKDDDDDDNEDDDDDVV
jgi:hypothetical protein